MDAPGVRRVLAACAEAKRKGLSVVSGLNMRYDNGARETIRRIHDGAVGRIHTLQANDYRGEICIILINHGKEPFVVAPKMRIAQLVLSPVVRAEFVNSEQISLTQRGEGRFGHTGAN